MSSYKVLIIFVVQLIIISSSEILEIEDGRLEGTIMETRKGSAIYAFLKIPYAEPPIGNLRFQPPVVNKKWEGVLNATKFGPSCMQSRFPTEKSEDCLFINVYTKSLDQNDLKPVIVYIHGGAFEIGSGSTPGPDYLLDRDVVLVTFNYRLGPFGFLALGTENVFGNMGLKDQSLALKWVQRNIKNFGGNPNLVTLSGMSAGGHSVTAHMVSDMSKGLFHRAISMSGAITWQKGFERSDVPMAIELATRLNCPVELKEMFHCFMQKSAQEISEAGAIDFYGCPKMPWIPVLEPDFGHERFFTDDPNKLFRDGNFSKVPVIIGITADEFIQPLQSLLTNDDSIKQLNENFTDFAPNCFFFSGTEENSVDTVAETLRNYYLPFDEIDKRSFNSLSNLLGDGVIGYGVHRFTRFTSSFTDVYYYKFTYQGRYSFFKFPRDKPFGVHHGDDDQYVLSGSLFPKISFDDPENFMVERMTRIWEQFAWFGNPNNQSDEHLADLVWPKHNLADEYFLDIGVNVVEKQGLYLERYSVWDDLEFSSSSSRSQFLGGISWLSTIAKKIFKNL